MGKRTAQKDTIIDITSDSQVNSNFPYRWSPASLTFNNYFYLFLYLSFSDLAALTARIPVCLSDMKLTRAITLQSTYHCRVINCYLHGCRTRLSTRLPGEQVLIFPAAGYIGICYKYIVTAMCRRKSYLYNLSIKFCCVTAQNQIELLPMVLIQCHCCLCIIYMCVIS